MQTIARKNVIFTLKTNTDTKGIDQLDNRVSGLRQRFQQTRSVFAGIIAANVVQAGVRALGGLIDRTTTLTATAEQSAISFRTLIGSTREANALLAELNSFSVSTPFEPAQIREAAKTLLGFGIESDKVLNNIELIGNASAATGADLNSLALVFGQVAGAGRLNGQDALQFVNQGLPIYQLLSESLGVSIDQVRELQSSGEITFDVLTEAFEKASEEGGKFAGALVAQSQSLSGLISTLRGVADDILTRIGSAFLPIARTILPPVIEALFRFSALVERNAPLLAALAQQMIGFGRNVIAVVRTAINPIIAGFNNLVEAFDGVAEGSSLMQDAINRTGRAIVFLGRVIGSVLDAFAGLVGFFRNNAFGQAIIRPFIDIQTVIANLPAVINGFIGVVRQAGVNIQNFFAGIAVDAAIAFEKLKGLNPFADVNQALIDNLEIARKEVTSSSGSLVDAFNDGFNEINGIEVDIPDLVVQEDLDNANVQGQEVGKEIIEGIDQGIKEGTDTIAGSLDALEAVVSGLKSRLENTNLEDVGLLTNLTSQLKDAQLEVENAQLLLEFLRRDLEGDFAPTADVSELQGLSGINLEIPQDDLTAQTDALKERITDNLQDLPDSIEFSDSLLSNIFGGGVAGLLTTEDEQALRDSFQQASDIAIESINTILEAQEAAAEKRVDIQTGRVEAARLLAEQGKEEQLSIEMDRLNQLQDAQEQAVRRKQQFAALEIAANQALAISNSIVAITEQAKLPFPANVAAIAATSIALGLQVAAASSTIASSFSGLPAFKDGVDIFKGSGTNRSDSNLVRLSNNEGVVDARTNLLRQRAGLTNDRLRVISQQALGMRTTDIVAPSIGVSRSDILSSQSGMKSLEREFKGVRSEIKQLRQEMSMNKTIVVNKAPSAEVWQKSLEGGIEKRRRLHN